MAAVKITSKMRVDQPIGIWRMSNRYKQYRSSLLRVKWRTLAKSFARTRAQFYQSIWKASQSRAKWQLRPELVAFSDKVVAEVAMPLLRTRPTCFSTWLPLLVAWIPKHQDYFCRRAMTKIYITAAINRRAIQVQAPTALYKSANQVWAWVRPGHEVSACNRLEVLRSLKRCRRFKRMASPRPLSAMLRPYLTSERNRCKTSHRISNYSKLNTDWVSLQPLYRT